MTKTRASPSASTCNHIGILKIKDSVFVDTEEGVTDLVDWITAQHIYNEGYPPPLYIDVEGERLGRDGTVSLLTIFQYPTPRRECVYVIDVHTLGSQVFSTVGAFGKTLEEILESPAFLKIFFDDRNDSDALSSLYCIKLQGVRDVQLMESAQRQTMSSRKFLGSLAKCIDEKAYHSEEKERWRLRKEKGDKLWNPREGDSYRAFNARPLPKDLMAYCVSDVQYLPRLYERYKCGTKRWMSLVVEASQNRVLESQKPGYLPQGPGRALSPWTVEQNRMLDSWDEVNRQRDYFDHYESTAAGVEATRVSKSSDKKKEKTTKKVL